MRIKLFEEFGNKFYWEISYNEFNNMGHPLFTGHPAVQKFTNKEIYQISPFLGRSPDDFMECGDVFSLFARTTDMFNGNIEIFKMPDEYYFIRYNNRRKVGTMYYTMYYKCDQMDGLIKWLEDFTN